MHPLERKISSYIARYSLISPDEKCIIVAVSGGADSVALLAALQALGYNCTAAHCNFHLREAESDRDTHHVEEICRKLNTPLSIKHFDVASRRMATGESVEMACRTLRYLWFREIADTMHCHSVAVAHHRDDNIETMLLNMMRGTGLSGLTGMSPRNGLIIRPMLECTRPEIKDYLKTRALGYVTDSTNACNDYLRNRLRNLVIPAMTASFPNAKKAMSHTINCLSDTEAFYRHAVEEKKAAYTDKDFRTIYLSRLINTEPQARLLLYEWLKPYGFNATQTDKIAATQHSGAIFEAGKKRVTINRGTAEITDIHSDKTPADTGYVIDITQTILNPAYISVNRLDVSKFRSESDPRVLFLDESVLKGNPVFELRHWRHGDRIAPFGMQGSRKVSDVFSDAKLSVNEKEKIWLLTRNGVVLWIAGLRTSRHFAVTTESNHYLRLQLHN